MTHYALHNHRLMKLYILHPLPHSGSHHHLGLCKIVFRKALHYLGPHSSSQLFTHKSHSEIDESRHQQLRICHHHKLFRQSMPLIINAMTCRYHSLHHFLHQHRLISRMRLSIRSSRSHHSSATPLNRSRRPNGSSHVPHLDGESSNKQSLSSFSSAPKSLSRSSGMLIDSEKDVMRRVELHARRYYAARFSSKDVELVVAAVLPDVPIHDRLYVKACDKVRKWSRTWKNRTLSLDQDWFLN